MKYPERLVMVRRSAPCGRLHLVADALDPALSKAERGAIVRALAAEEHVDANGERQRVSANTLYRWIHAYRELGPEGLRDQRPEDRGRAPAT